MEHRRGGTPASEPRAVNGICLDGHGLLPRPCCRAHGGVGRELAADVIVECSRHVGASEVGSVMLEHPADQRGEEGRPHTLERKHAAIMQEAALTPDGNRESEFIGR